VVMLVAADAIPNVLLEIDQLAALL
jgi:hypothetical protein